MTGGNNIRQLIQRVTQLKIGEEGDFAEGKMIKKAHPCSSIFIEVHLLREELLEVEEARYCAMRTIEYLENRHPKKQD